MSNFTVAQLRELAVELNRLGAKETLGFFIKSKQPKEQLEFDLADAVQELFLHGNGTDFAGSLTAKCLEVWDHFKLKEISIQEAIGDGDKELPTAPTTTENPPLTDLNQAAPVTKKRGPSKWAWLKQRLTSSDSAAPATRENLLKELKIAFPLDKESTISTLLSDCKNPTYNRAGVEIVFNPETKIYKALNGSANPVTNILKQGVQINEHQNLVSSQVA